VPFAIGLGSIPRAGDPGPGCVVEDRANQNDWSEACAGYIDPRLYLGVTFWGQWNRIGCSNNVSACAAANQAGTDALDRPWRSKINEDQAGYLNAKPSIAAQSG
jgi:hypothetical protein